MFCYILGMRPSIFAIYVEDGQCDFYNSKVSILFSMAIIKHKEQRVAMFIDTQNLYHTARNLYKRKVNFGAILKDAVAGRKLVRALAYVIKTEQEDEKSFFEALTKLGIETKVKDLQIFSGGAKKADWDVGMAVDAITMSPKLDAVILVTGDGDFVPLVEYLQIHSGAQVEVVTFGKSASMKLKEAADDFLDLSDNSRKYLIGGPVPFNPPRRQNAPGHPQK